MRGKNALGPDGFTFKFIKTYWDTFRDDIIRCVMHFEEFGFLARGCNFCINKIISKILALRLKSVIGRVISDVQSAYVEGRNILGGPMVINALYSWAKKVDFDKAFDSINWEYLDSVLAQMRFVNKWRMWIKGCLRSSRALVIINGSPTVEFEISKGVRQGDPLSPFLFIIIMEGLHIALEEA
uniref:Reverse transcriptase domain-containing protein n=1 Tax=Lactuca sativa TaxID=4236 RepID=A0A9R1VTV0_LACSA|nr:hypothetical protein LSAT_V11C400178620 [Lactuca sativa]